MIFLLIVFVIVLLVLANKARQANSSKVQPNKIKTKTPKTLHAIRKEYAKDRFHQLKDPELLAKRPYWMYISNATMTKPCHAEWDGLVLRHDDPWWEKHYPPNGPECRCRVTAVKANKFIGQSAPEETP